MLILVTVTQSLRQQAPRPVATDWPGLRRQCPPLSGQRGRPGRCRDSAAPEPPAHCKFCSQNLQEEISNKRQKSHSASQAVLSRCRLSCLCRSCRSRCAWWCPSPPSGSPRWPETWSLHRATPCQSYTPFLWKKKQKQKYLVFLMLKIYFYNSDLWKSCCKNSISLLLSANAKGWWGHQRASNTNSRQTKLPLVRCTQPSNFLMMQPGRTKNQEATWQHDNNMFSAEVDSPQATLALGSCFRWASRTASLIWSQILSVEKQQMVRRGI